MIRPTILGIAGRARSGKSTTADLLLRMGVSAYTYSFADPIRAMLSVGLGIDMAKRYWRDRKECAMPEFGGHSPRSMMQLLGTEWGRDMIHPDIWLTLAKKRFNQRGPHMLVTDVRFENEAAWVRSLDGVILHVFRKDTPDVRPHQSEHGVAVGKGDFAVLNDSTIESLQNRLAVMFGVGE